MNPAKITAENPQSSQISIVFENPLKAYFSGEMIFGTVKFIVRENQSVQKFCVCLRGEFYYRKGDTEHTEIIFDETSPTDYRGAGEGNMKVEFCLALRPMSPSSIQSPLGGIRYHVLAKVVFREGGSLQVTETSEPISVNHPQPIPDSCSERRARTSERAGLICCIGFIAAELSISSAFLLSGQAVFVSGSVFNGTHTSVQSTDIYLVQFLQRQKDARKMKRTVASLAKGAVLPGRRQTWSSDHFVVPPLPPTWGDLFFKTWYEIIMEIQKISGKVIKLKIPVVIGNISATEYSFPIKSSKGHKIEWKSSEPQAESDEFTPLYVNHAT